MRKSSFAQLFLKLKPLIAESRQLLRKPDLIVEYKAHHRPTATLGPHRLHLQFVIFAYIKQRLDDSNLLLHPLPVEQMLIFLGRQMHQHPVVRLHLLDKYLRQLRFPEAVHRFVSRKRKPHTMFHAVGHNAVQRSQQTIQETRNP